MDIKLLKVKNTSMVLHTTLIEDVLQVVLVKPSLSRHFLLRSLHHSSKQLIRKQSLLAISHGPQHNIFLLAIPTFSHMFLFMFF